MEVRCLLGRLVVQQSHHGSGFGERPRDKGWVRGGGSYHLSLELPSPNCGPCTDRLCVLPSQQDPKLLQLA